ncbi:Ras-GEF domain-containing protein [Mycena chlorophos]|uniref:Ras-GEF domain-containing protein n=1 Tax=Mycena chlorophos TaxID=658473 RepID=A0A8H6S6U9_MYCCL|nr:Ras-GEF domain-containing protein [Mycena chlorophos]
MPTSNLLQSLPLAVDSLSFGIYTSLFVQCLHLLYHTRRAHYRLYLSAMCALYLLSTLHIVLAFTWAAITDTADYAIYEVFSLKQPLPVLSRPGDPPVVHALATLIKALWVVSNGIADAVLIHRLYIIWGGNPRAVALPVVSYSLTMISAVVDLLPLPPAATRSALIVAMSSVFLTNVLSSALTAGRIWFMSRSCKRVVGTKRRARYTQLMVIILESGLIYPALLVITIAVFVAPTTPTVAVLSCFAVLYHIVGIAPTLIIVRVSSGVNDDEEVGPFPRSLPLPTDNSTSRLTTLHFAVPETVAGASPDEPLELNFRVKGSPI